MTELSKRAVRELLKGGLPVADPKFEDSNNNYRSGIVYTSSSRRSSNSKGGDATSPSGFGSQIIEILKIWKKKKSYEPVEVYDMVVGELFPDNRPKEIVLYENSKSISDARVSSLAHTVVSWAAKADRLDDLKKRIATRESYPTAEVQAMVLRGMIALEEDNFTVAKENLVKLVNHITNQPVPRNVDLACHVAVPSWLADKSLRGPCIEIYRKKIATDKNPSLGKLTSRVNQHLAANGGDKEIGNFFEGYLTSQQAKYSNYGGDYGVYQMQQSLYKIKNDIANSKSGRCQNLTAKLFDLYQLGKQEPAMSLRIFVCPRCATYQSHLCPVYIAIFWT